MPRLSVVRLIGYREWIESLGEDREGFVQTTQAKLYGHLQELAWSRGSFAIPLTFDHYIILSNGLTKEEHSILLEAIESKSPCKVRIASLTHKYPGVVQYIASKLFAKTNDKIIYIDGPEDEYVIAHVDLNDVTRLISETSIYETYVEIVTLLYQLTRQIFEVNGLVSYQGGDNFIAILPYGNHEVIINKLPEFLKVGVGVSKKPREAISLATKALDTIRKGGVDRNYLILSASS